MKYLNPILRSRKYLLSILFSLLCFLLPQKNYAQFYLSSGGEIIFSWATIELEGNELSPVVRFSPVFNTQSLLSYHPNNYFGLFTGFSIRNVGFIYDIPDSPIRKKHRTYNAGFPIGIKLGVLDKSFIFAGYEVEFPFSYKEKTFINDKKEDKFLVWFTDRTPPVMHTLFGGISFPFGTSLRFKYYLTGFFNQDYTEFDETGQIIQPFENLDVNVVYISLSFGLFQNYKELSLGKNKNDAYSRR